MKLDIASLVLDSKAVTFDYPDMKGFSVDLNYVSKTKMNDLRKSCMITKYDTKLGIPVQNLDNELWIPAFCKEVIKGWKGLTLGYLAQLLLIDEAGLDLTEEVEYSVENAVTLLTKSTAFDNWVNSCLTDISNFRK